MSVQPLANLKTCPAHSPASIASSSKVRDVRISPDGRYVVYQVQPFYKATERITAELWLAQTSIAESARQLTDGLDYDRDAVFHPNGKRIFFLSSRGSSGGGSALIYAFGIPSLGESEVAPTPTLVSSNFGPKGVQAFEISPDGNYLAFTSADDDAMSSINTDVKVYGQKIGLSRLRLCDLKTGDVRPLNGVRSDKHVESFTWSADSKTILYRLRDNRPTEYTESTIILERISIDASAPHPTLVGLYARSPAGPNIWLMSGHIFTLQNFLPQNSLDARTLFAHFPASSDAHSILTRAQGCTLYGERNDAVRMINANPGAPFGEIAVEVSEGMDTLLDIVDIDPTDGAANELASPRTRFTLFKTNNDAIWFGSWDAKKILDHDGHTSYIVAVVLSSTLRHEPPNVWVGKLDCDGRTGGDEVIPLKNTDMVKLSSHLKWLSDAPVIGTMNLHWRAADGMPLDGIIRFPPGHKISSGPLPTVLFIHGGPYRRDIPDYMPYFCNWRELFASAGYLVLSPNYRGSQGRGHDFASAANTGIGVYDWSDCESMVDEAIRRGLADPDHLAVAGWSHGGSLTAWGVTRTKKKFKAAIVGAGVTHWEGMVMESGSPELEAAIGQRSPWDVKPFGDFAVTDGRVDSPNSRYVANLSPIHAVSDVSTAVLILHGERDERVPLGQAIGFWRGLKRKAATRGREGVQLIIYPREPHGFVERKHAEDVLTRVLEHFAKWV